MNASYLKIIKGLSITILLSSVLAACGGGSATGINPPPTDAGTNPGTVPAPPATQPPSPTVPPPSTPAADNPNPIGINIAAPLDYEIDRLYANAISTSRDFRSGLDANGSTPATVDSNGWPMTDFSFYVWGSGDQKNGRYTLSFKGQATAVTSNPVGNIPVSYDPATNTSSGSFLFANSTGTLTLSFAGTKRTSTSALGSGVTSIKLMRPLTPGSTQSYPETTLFTNPIKALIAKFSVIRFMDFLSTNANQQVNWSERPLPTWASFNRNPGGTYGWQGIGGPLEHVILLSNELGKDPWINIPIGANDNYILNVARLFAYGSDGVNPYTSTQANPVYPPLNPSLKVYVEYSNEIWNSAGPFPQFHNNCQAASDELVSTGGNSPLNWDRLWNGTAYNRASPTGWDYTMCWRNIAKRGVEVSNIFRSVFGDAAMITRVRPVLMTQLGASTRVLAPATKMMLDYYNNMAGNFVATAHPPSYYFYGAGGSGYYNPSLSVSTLDSFFADPGMTPAGFAPQLQADAKYVAAMGLKRVAYEGGPSLDMTNGVRDAISAQAVNDARMTTALVNMHNAWSSNNGDLFVSYRATGDYQWGFTGNINNLSTPKLNAIDIINSTPRAPLTFGTLVPGSMLGTTADTCSSIWSCNVNNFRADGTRMTWGSYTFRSATSGQWTISLSVANAIGASVAVYVDGKLVGTQSTANGTLSFNVGTVAAGLHGVVVRAAAGSFAINSVAVAQN